MNAARGLASTVIFTINQLVSSFVMAAEPQLVKLYGAGEKEKFHRLIFNVSKYTLFLLAVFITPVLLEIDFVLALWLTEVPDYTVIGPNPIFKKKKLTEELIDKGAQQTDLIL